MRCDILDMRSDIGLIPILVMLMDRQSREGARSEREEPDTEGQGNNIFYI